MDISTCRPTKLETASSSIVELRMARLQKWNVPLPAAPVREHSSRLADRRVRPIYNFNHHEPKAPTAKLKAESECAFCHEASAKKDEVWTQFYPLLDDQQGQ
jgi:hypothetical protein